MVPTLSTIEEEVRLTGPKQLWRCRLQFQAMSSAFMVSIAGGMKLAWSTFESPAGKFLTSGSTHVLTVAWFVGVAVGAITAATFVQRVSKNVAHYTSGALLIFGGILFTCWPMHFSMIVTGCICEGFAYGLVQVQALVTGGEVAHKQLRGLLLSGERVFLWLGVCLQLFYARLWYALEPANGHAWHLDQLHGVAVICLGLASLGLAWLHRLESPLLLHRQQRCFAVPHTLQQLLHARHPNHQEVADAVEDYKQQLAHDAGLTACTAFWRCNALPLLKLTLVHCCAALSLTLPYSRTFLTHSWHSLDCGTNCVHVLAISGLLGSIVGGCLIDHCGRRRLSVVSILLAGIAILIVSGIFEHMQSTQLLLHSRNFELITSLLLLHQFIICAGIGVASTVYMAEAFTLSLKASCIALVLVCEQMLQIGMAMATFNADIGNATFFFCMGTVSLMLGVGIFICMPETKRLPLSVCLIKFDRCPRIHF